MDSLELTTREFKLFREFIHREIGISLGEQKHSLVKSRLKKRVHELGLNSYKEYYNYIEKHSSDEEMFHLISAISTNVTSFFREENQWNYLREHINSMFKNKKDRKIRVWSAACSSGEEPYSIAMFLKETLQNYDSYDIKILATDISKKVLTKALSGVYLEKDIKGVPKYIIRRYFKKYNYEDDPRYEIHNELKEQITFRMFNLIYDDFKVFKNSFDLIFCRNVMIYFDSNAQKALVSNFYNILEDDGLLLIGHSESLTRNSSDFKLLRPSIYKRI